MNNKNVGNNQTFSNAMESAGADTASAIRKQVKGIREFMRAKPLGAAGGIILVLFVLIAIFAPLLTTFDPDAQVLADRLQGPSIAHTMGTDDYGRDVYSRIIFGSRTSLYVSLLAVAFGITLGTIIGLSSGYIGGKYDLIVQRVLDSMMSIPGLVLAMVIMAALGTNMNNVVLAIGIGQVPHLARIVRGSTLAIKSSSYIEAARAMGCKPMRIQLKHILPNVTAPIIIMATAGLGAAILVESSLSFLGLGVPPPAPSWGRMLSGSARKYMETAPWLVVFPGMAISLAVLGFNLFGDALRDWWDPKLRGARSMGIAMLAGKTKIPFKRAFWRKA
jgi:peptide/nickel transport system permease protein